MMTHDSRLVRLLRKPRSFEALCDTLQVSPRALRKLLAMARKDGVAVEVTGETVGIRPALPSTDVQDVQIVAQPGSMHCFAVASDLHFGSKYHLRNQFKDFISRAYAHGARTVLLGGDLLDGCYRHGRWELSHHGFQDQCADFYRHLPAFPGLSYVGITGNHDQTFEQDSGMVVHEAINSFFEAGGRTDLTLLAARGAYVRLRARGERRGLIVELWHPLKGPAYALSYKLQKHIEGYAVGCKPDCLFTGHWHQSIYFSTRGVHAFSAGTFQGGGSSFSKSLGGAPSIGGWIVDYSLTPDGTVRTLRPEWVSYYERETAREIEMN